jgi:hypothetical protein
VPTTVVLYGAASGMTVDSCVFWWNTDELLAGGSPKFVLTNCEFSGVVRAAAEFQSGGSYHENARCVEVWKEVTR